MSSSKGAGHGGLAKPSDNDLEADVAKESPDLSLWEKWKARSEFWGWNFFTANMGTGAVSILIGGCQFPFHGQRVVGTVWFMMNLVLFTINLAGTFTRAIYHPTVFKHALISHEDGLYLPCLSLAFASLYVGVVDYGLPYCGFWLTRVWFVVWFIYLGTTFALGMLMEATSRGHLRSLSTISPADTLAVLPFMLTGTLGASLAGRLPPTEAAYVIIVSYFCQGMGWWMAILKLSVWMGRNMTYPRPPTRFVPGYLMAVGPPGFSAFAFTSLGNLAQTAFPAANILGGEAAGQAFYYNSVWFSFLLWGTCWWLILSPVSILIAGSIRAGQVEWSMGWWSFTFPLVGFWLAAGKFGQLIPSTTFKVIEVVGIFITLGFWLINSIMMASRIYDHRLLVKAPPLEVPVTFQSSDGMRTIYQIPSAERNAKHSKEQRKRVVYTTGEDLARQLSNNVGMEA